MSTESLIVLLAVIIVLAIWFGLLGLGVWLLERAADRRHHNRENRS